MSPRGDSDHFSFAVHGGTAGVPAVDSDVRLKYRRIGDVVFDRRDSSIRQRRFEVALPRKPAADHVIRAAGHFRVPDGPDGIADAHALGVSQLQCGEIFSGDAKQRQIGAALRQRRRITFDLERHLLAVRKLDFVHGRDVIDFPLGSQRHDVLLERLAPIQPPQLVDREMFQERGNRAVAQQLLLQRFVVASAGNDVTAGENPSIGMNDEATPRPTRPGLHHALRCAIAAGDAELARDRVKRARGIVKLRGRVCADAHHRRFDTIGHFLNVVEPRHVAPARNGADQQNENAAGTRGHGGY